jgi:catechol 2,3-dioxygenase-like lactoylglutathione lyase family enzyme
MLPVGAMMPIPTGTESARPFLPTKDLDKSKAFYEALGFEKILDGDVAIFEIGYTGFILQRLYDEKWAEHTMMQLLVDDLDAWWAHIESLDLPGKFGIPKPKPPAMQPWGLRIAYLVDPAGILWHVAQRRTDAPSD